MKRISLSSFNKAWTVSNVRQILKDYTNSEYEFICFSSPLFARIFRYFNREIRNLAFEFDSTLTRSEGALFSTPKYESRAVRIAFLNYCLNRLLSMKPHPLHVTTTIYILGQPPKPNVSLYRLPHNAIIREGDAMTSRLNSPGDGFMLATDFIGRKVSQSPRLVFYRPKKLSTI